MKLIELLNKLSNKDVDLPTKILYNGLFEMEYVPEVNDYKDIEDDTYLLEDFIFQGHLNDDVDILEITISYKPDKIERFMFTLSDNKNKNIERDIINLGIKVNEIIDKVNKL